MRYILRMDRHTLANGQVSAVILAQGAELASLQDASGHQYLWQAGPEWPRHAPLLFPIIGELNDGRYLHRGRTYRMGRHGFARDRRFVWLETTPERCRLVLTDDAASHAIYPFAFRLEAAFLLRGATLSITYALTNTGAEDLPASLGAHPAFRWPLTDGVPKTAHSLTFASPEPEPIKRLNTAGLIIPETNLPLGSQTLPLDPALFGDDAMIFDPVASRSIRYAATGGPALTVAWDGFPSLGVWSKPEADLLCIEPWHGTADPAGFEEDFVLKPGLMHIPPGAERLLTYSITLEAA